MKKLVLSCKNHRCCKIGMSKPLKTCTFSYFFTKKQWKLKVFYLYFIQKLKNLHFFYVFHVIFEKTMLFTAQNKLFHEIVVFFFFLLGQTFCRWPARPPVSPRCILGFTEQAFDVASFQWHTETLQSSPTIPQSTPLRLRKLWYIRLARG